jgi:hypothetical protein
MPSYLVCNDGLVLLGISRLRSRELKHSATRMLMLMSGEGQDRDGLVDKCDTANPRSLTAL